MREYAVLLEVQGDSFYGDHLFVFLGVYPGKTRAARRLARNDHAISPDAELVTVPTRFWTAEK